MVRTWTWLPLYRLWHNPPWQRKEMLIFFNNTQSVLQESSESLVQIIYCDRWLFHRAGPSVGRSPLWYRWSRQKPVARFKQPGNLTGQATAAKHAGQVWLCASQRSISHRGASAIKCFRKVNAQPLQSKVTDSHGRLRPPPRCDCCFKELSDSLTSLYSAAAAPLRCKLHLLPSPLSSPLFSFLSHSD